MSRYRTDPVYRIQHRNAMREHKRQLHARGLCSQCGQKPNGSVYDAWFCTDCSRKVNLRMREEKQAKLDRVLVELAETEALIERLEEEERG